MLTLSWLWKEERLEGRKKGKLYIVRLRRLAKGWGKNLNGEGGCCRVGFPYEWGFRMVGGRARLGMYGQILFVGEWRVARS